MSPKVILTVTAGSLKGQAFEFEERTTCLIGRSLECNLRIPDDDHHGTISRYHCLLDINPPSIRVRDFGSRNGTFVNGQKIGQRSNEEALDTPAKNDFPEYELQTGDEIKLGNTIFCVTILKQNLRETQKSLPVLSSLNLAPPLYEESKLSSAKGYNQALDLGSIIKASQAIISEINLSKLLKKLIKIVLENAGAQSGVLILKREENLLIEATGTSEQILLWHSTPIESTNFLPLSAIHYVVRTHKNVILTDASQEGNFVNDPYILTHQPKSLLCTPILGQGKLIGILYLENNLLSGAFTPENAELLNLLCSQAATSLENALLYEAQKDYARTLEHKVKELQETETELRQSEERYRSLIVATSTIAWIWMTDAQGRAYDIPALREYTGQTIQEVSGLGWLDALHPDDRDRTAQIWMQAVATKSLYEIEYRLRGTDGNYRYFSARGVPILAEDGSIHEWVGICADIHDRKQAEIALQKANEELEFRVQERTIQLTQALEQIQQEIAEREQAEAARKVSEARFREIARNLPGTIFQFTSRKGVWGVDYISEYIWELAGITVDEMIEDFNCFIARIHPDDLNSYITSVDEAIVKGITWHYEGRLIKPSGEIRWWQGDSTPIVNHADETIFFGVALDITARKQAEIALAESEQQYRLLVETSQDIILSCDAQGHITFINQAVKQIYGYQPEEMLGHLFTDFGAPEQIAKDLEAFQYLLRDGSLFQYESLHLAKNGRPINLLFNAVVLRDSQDKIIGTTSTASDITERKQAEAALQKAKEAADAASHAKGEFLSKMSHELRTPLNAILGFTQILARDHNLTPQQQEHLGIINRAGEHLLTLINDVLEMSKIEAGRIELHENSFDLYRLLDSLEEMFKLKAESKGLKLTFDRILPLPQFIKTDESKLRQVLINLLGNAIKFTEKGGIILRVNARETINPHDPNSGSSQTQFLHFEVEDTGLGIAPKDLTTLFDPFVQTETGKKSQSGTGLGLSISRQFVQLMGGDITVNSCLDQGTIFQFDVLTKLAITLEIPPQQSSQKVIGLAPNHPIYRILVVDDIWESRLLITNLLSPIGFEVRQAANGQEAITIWQEWHPHLIWMDMQMPVLDGYEATKHIKAQSKEPKTIIIGLTASAFEKNRAKVLEAGCDDFLSKPFREEVLFTKMSTYLDIHYLYEDSQPVQDFLASSSQTAAIAELTPADLASMSSDWIAQLYQAATELDDDLIRQLIQQIPSSHSDLANSLADLAQKLRFDTLINLIQKIPYEDFPNS